VATSDVRAVEFVAYGPNNLSRPPIVYGNTYPSDQGRSLSPYSSLPSYQPERTNNFSINHHPSDYAAPYRSTSPVNLPPLAFPSLPPLQLNQNLSKKNSAYKAAQSEPSGSNYANFPTFRLTSETTKVEKKEEVARQVYDVPRYQSNLEGIGKVTESNIHKESNYMSTIKDERSGTNQNSFSPLNISEYVRPAHSVHYEINKMSPSLTKKEDGSFPLDSKAVRTPEMSEGGSNELQPQYVVEHFKVGSRYEGYKLNGMRHGQGKFYYQDGGYYDGEWRNNKMEGFGTLFYQSNHKAYEGMWSNDQFHGQGTLYNDNPL
jgi:hypothetical protein